MRLTADETERLLATPDRLPAALLLYGEDAARVAQLREAAVLAAAGPQGEADMRVDRLAAAALRADPGALDAALRTRGFFPGPRVVVLTEAGDGLTETVLAALPAAGPEARLVISGTASLGSKKSSLVKGFETARTAAAVACAASPLDAAAVVAALGRAGAGPVTAEAAEDLARLSGEIDRLSFARLTEKLALWGGPVDAAAVAACAPPAGAGETGEAMLALLRRDGRALRRALARAMPAGSDAVGTAIDLARHARAALEMKLAMDEERADPAGAARRVWLREGEPFRRALADAARGWSRADLERLAQALHDLDARLRGPQREPERAQTERALMRFALAR